MTRLLAPTVIAGLLAAGLGAVGEETPGSKKRSIAELESRLAAINRELGGLAHMSLNSGVGPIGGRSKDYTDPDHTEWFQIDLGSEGPIDEVILIPALWRSGQEGFISDGFPASFKIVVGGEADPSGTTVVEIADTSGLVPRDAPLTIPTPGAHGSWVRVEATRLTRRAFDDRYLFQLSEILVFHGEENRALRRPVTTLSPPGIAPAWNPSFLVDGILPYLMNAAQGEPSIAFASDQGIGEQPSITLDLGSVSPVSGIRLHAVDQSDTVPQGQPGDFGFPRRFRVEVAQKEDFSDAHTILEAEVASPNKGGPIMEWSFEETSSRFLRLTALEPYVRAGSTHPDGTLIGFAEIEALSRGHNVAMGKTPTSSFEHPPQSNRTLASLTDGQNLYGAILPTRQWLGELARRHALETERPIVVADLAAGYARQKTILRRMGWLATVLLVVIAVVIFFSYLRGLRKEARIRERIAANLHDNLGANLHAIGILGDLAKEAVDSPEELADTVDRIRRLTERTGTAARDCANMLDAHHLCKDLVADMRRDAASLLADLDHRFSCEGDELLHSLPRRKRIDLCMFYKESLANVIKHSGATRVETSLVATPGAVRLTVTDNGQGVDGETPTALKRRARLLGADFGMEQPETGGTRVLLNLKTRRLGTT